MSALLLASSFSGIFLALVFPPWRIDLLVWLALVPLLWSIRSSRNFQQAAYCGWVSGFFFFLIDLRWIYDTLTIHGHFSTYISGAISLLLTAGMAMGTAFFCGFSRFVHNAGIPYWIIFPVNWIGVEFARTFLFSGFPWDLLGYSLSERSNLIQVVDITGVYGLSFLIVFVNNAILETLVNRKTSFTSVATQLIFAVVMIAGCTVYGWTRISLYADQINESKTYTIGVLQGAISQDVKWNDAYRSLTFRTYDELAKESVLNGANLLIWPETSIPVVIGGEDLAWMDAINISRNLNTPMLIGAPSQTDSKGQINYYNSAFLVDGSEILSAYDKIHLVPFGEYMPLSWLIPLGPGMAAREADFTPGAVMTVMSPPTIPSFSVLICYEAIFPALSRIAINNGARFLVNITNDGWFDMTAAPAQHLSMAKFRAVENRVWLLRSANTGISAAVDPVGRIVNSIPLGQSGWMNVNMPQPTGVGSFYTKFGDVFALSCIIIMALTFFWAALHNMKFKGIRYDTIRH